MFEVPVYDRETGAEIVGKVMRLNWSLYYDAKGTLMAVQSDPAELVALERYGGADDPPGT